MAENTSTVALGGNPAIDIVRQASTAQAKVGEAVTFVFKVKNIGNVTLTSLQAQDSVLGTIEMPATLAPNATATLTRTYVLQESDLPGPLASEVTVTAASVLRGQVVASARSVVQVIAAPAIDVAVNVVASRLAGGSDGTRARVGDTLTLYVIVKNTGNVTLRNVSATDDQGGAIALDATTVAPGATLAGTLQRMVDERDMPGPITYHLTVVGDGVGGTRVSSAAGIAISLPSARLVSAIWHDLNGNGTRSPDEPGVGGVVVNLCQGQHGSDCVAALTADDGSFVFDSQYPGTYRLAVSIPTGFRPTVQAGVITGVSDSDADGQGVTGTFELLPGMSEDRVGVGLVAAATPTGLEASPVLGANRIYLPAVKR